MRWAKWVLKQTESEWRQVKLVERVIYNLNKQAVSCAFCFNCGSSLWKRTERSRKTSLLEPVNVLHFLWQLIDLKQTIDYCKINLQLNDKSFPLEFSHLSLWRDGLDVCHVAGDRQDVELVINDNTVFAGCKWQNESENSETKSIKVSNLKKKNAPNQVKAWGVLTSRWTFPPHPDEPRSGTEHARPEWKQATVSKRRLTCEAIREEVTHLP